MPVRFIIARAGAGKTHHCLQAVAAALNDAGDARRLILLVPEQASFQMERALVERAAAGGYWRAEVLSFTRLASRLFEESGGEPVLLRKGARAMALRRIATARPGGRGAGDGDSADSDNAVADAGLADVEFAGAGLSASVFGRAARTPGFFASLDRMVEELIAENVTPAQLAESSRRVSDERTRRKLAAVADVYGRYLDWLGEERLDAAMHLAVLRERVGSVAWLARAAVWVDGFAGFTGQEFATLVALARCAGEVTITLLMDPAAEVLRQPRAPGDPLALFDRTEQTYRRLVLELEAAGVQVDPPLLLRPAPTPRFIEDGRSGARPVQQGDGRSGARPVQQGDGRSGARPLPVLARLEQALATPAGLAADDATDDAAAKSEVGSLKSEVESPKSEVRDVGSPQGLIASVATGPSRSRLGSDFGASGFDAVRIVECATHRDELREAARCIRRLMADGGGRVRFRDFAVIARDLEPFADLVAEVFDAYGIPCFLDRRRPMAVHPLCRFVASLLEAVRDDLPPRAMGRLLRTGLTPLRRRDAERLENLLLRLEFRGARNWGRPTWDPGETLPARLESMSRPRRSPDQDGEARSGLRSREIDVKRLELLAAIEPLLTLANADPHSTAARASVRQPSTVGRASARQPSTVGRASVPAANGRMWADAILTALRKLRVPRRLEAWIRRAQRERDWETAETHRLAWDSLCNLLDDLHDVLGDVPVTIDELQQTLSAALSELTLGLAPPTLDQVLVSSIERSRHPEIRHAWVFAFNEGVFPAPPAEDVLLSTAERRRVAETGLAAPAAHRDDVFGERLLAYIAFSRPSESLTISFATADDEGGALQPSLLLDEVRGALPGIQVQRPEPFAPPVCVEELANDYLDARGADVIDPRVPARHRRLIARTRENLHLQPRLEWLLRGERYDNRPTPLRDPTPQEGRSETGPTAELAQDQPETGPPVAWSTYPSEIETYVQCPFKHFATHRLRLDRRTPLPMLWEMGNVAHDLLAEVFRTASATGRLRDLSDEEWKALIGESVRRFDAIQPDDLAERNPRMAFMIRSTQRFVAEVAMAHVHRLRRSEFQPAGFELYFGPPRPAFDTGSSGADAVADQQAPSLPPLRLAVPDGRVVEVRGKIDRVDRCRVGGQDLLLIYDYKTFAATMNLDFLTQHRLALFLYMLAQRESGAGRVVGGLIAPWRPEIKNLEADYVAAAPAAEQLMYLYRPRGALEQAVAERLDTQLAPGPHSPVAMVKLNKDGDFAKQGDTHPGKKIAAGIELARATLLQVAGGVLSGRIEPSPLVENDRLACSMCDCKPLCRFERAGNDLRDPMSDLPTHAKLQHGGRS